MLGTRIQRARKAAGLSLRELGERTGVSHTAIAKFEHGDLIPSSDILLALSRATEVRVEYFLRPDERQLDGVEYRKHSKLGKRALERIEARVLDAVERYTETLELFPNPPGPPFSVPEVPHVGSLADVEAVAEAVRDAWQLGRDPIGNLADLLEEIGLLVLTVDVDDAGFDGLTASIGAHRVVVVGASWPADRQRFTLAHELGHLVLGGRLDEGIDVEAACNRFAGAFLASRSTMVAVFGHRRSRVESRELLSAKQELGVSMNALVYRLRDLEILSDGVARSLFVQGWRKREPGTPLPPERPARFERLVLHALAEDYIGDAKAAELLGVPMRVLRERRQVDGGASEAARQ